LRVASGTQVAAVLTISGAQEYNLAQLRPSEIDFLWDQLQDVIEHGKNKDTKTKLKLMQRIYRRLAKTMPKKKSRKRQ
jgi:hypothetical protein